MARTKQQALQRVAAHSRQKNTREKPLASKPRKRIAIKELNSTVQVTSNSASTIGNAQETKKFPCDHAGCSRSYTKLSNLNQHKKINHDSGDGGRRVFVCPHCGERQSTKYSHIRHIQRRHQNERIGNVDENEQTLTGDVCDLTEGAKVAMLQRFRAENKRQQEEIEELKKKILTLSEQLRTRNEDGPNEQSSVQTVPQPNETALQIRSNRRKVKNTPNKTNQTNHDEIIPCKRTGRVRKLKKDEMFLY